MKLFDTQGKRVVRVSCGWNHTIAVTDIGEVGGDCFAGVFLVPILY